jgi:hypothetical protein
MTTRKRCFGTLSATVLLASLFVAAMPCQAQSDLEKAFKQYNAAQVVGYIQPISDLFGTNMNSGFTHSAEISPSGFYFRLDIVGMASMVQDAQKTYTLLTPPGFNPGSFSAPTVFGGKSTVVQDVNTGLTDRSSDGILNTTVFPLIVPQLTVGNLFGTQFSVRYIALPKLNSDKVPNVSLWGVGARHSISQYIPAVPIDLAAGVYYSSFTFGDYIDAHGVAINAQASKSFSILTLYADLQWEKSTMNLKYTSTDAANPLVDISLTGANTFRFTAGLQLGLGPLKLFGDANFGSVTTFSAGFGFGG